ncbi:hypothetical protein V1470_00075 [Klebsiella michiganensis]|uniref:hypothetical protein n=1 Tax=Klebsiella michiganensis TaxID=1134687 RepID=UPI002E7C2787|nr:hypothetical protein [Klebsiella michiganensis]MEE1964693.1 hypothetical protein [Klebsiella michiganensis]
MTITLQAVNELIASLESAGELSIREQKFLKLAKAYQQLAAENVGLIRSAECLLHEASEVYRAYNKTQLPDGDLVDGQSLQEVWDAINATPATDRIYAGIKADGVDSGIETIITMLNHQAPGVIDAINVLSVHSFELREGAK